MALFSRSSSSSSGPATVVHARVADGEHLWLAVRGTDDRLVLQHTTDKRPGIEVPADVEDDLLVAVFPLAAALAGVDEQDVQLRLCHGRKASPVQVDLPPRPQGPTLPAPPTRDGRWQLSVDVVEDELVIRRRPLAPAVRVLGIRRTDEGVELRLDGDTAILLLAEMPGTVAGDPVPLVVDGLPVVRSRNVLARPQLAVALPPMLEPDVELRWLRDGRLATVRVPPTTGGTA